ncbi:MAG: hypothetical protein ABI548_26625 [Polyangiaceae bacterium]
MVLCCATVAQKKPSSLEKPGAVVHFRHTHERVTRCGVSAGGGACHEVRVKASAGTELSLTPVADPLVTQPTPERTAVQVSIPNSVGTASTELRVAEGTWQLTWTDQRAAFRVHSGQEFPVLLTTISGHCLRVATACTVQNDGARRSVSITPEFAVSP